MTPEIQNPEEMRITIPRELIKIFEREQTTLLKKYPIGAPGFWPVDPTVLGKLQRIFMANEELQAKFDIVIMPK